MEEKREVKFIVLGKGKEEKDKSDKSSEEKDIPKPKAQMPQQLQAVTSYYFPSLKLLFQKVVSQKGKTINYPHTIKVEGYEYIHLDPATEILTTLKNLEECLKIKIITQNNEVPDFIILNDNVYSRKEFSLENLERIGEAYDLINEEKNELLKEKERLDNLEKELRKNFDEQLEKYKALEADNFYQRGFEDGKKSAENAKLFLEEKIKAIEEEIKRYNEKSEEMRKSLQEKERLLQEKNNQLASVKKDEELIVDFIRRYVSEEDVPGIDAVKSFEDIKSAMEMMKKRKSAPIHPEKPVVPSSPERDDNYDDYGHPYAIDSKKLAEEYFYVVIVEKKGYLNTKTREGLKKLLNDEKNEIDNLVKDEEENSFARYKFNLDIFNKDPDFLTALWGIKKKNLRDIKLGIYLTKNGKDNVFKPVSDAGDGIYVTSATLFGYKTPNGEEIKSLESILKEKNIKITNKKVTSVIYLIYLE